MNKYLILVQIVVADDLFRFITDERMMIPEFEGDTTDDAILYLKGVTGAAIHDLMTYDCLLKKQPRDNLLRKWSRMIDFNFRIGREWKERTEKEHKILKHCPVVNPNPPIGDEVKSVMLIFHNQHMKPTQQLEVMGSVFVRVMQIKYSCYQLIADRRLRKFTSMMNSILRTDRVSGEYCP